jgi:hypothetical protein
MNDKDEFYRTSYSSGPPEHTEDAGNGELGKLLSLYRPPLPSRRLDERVAAGYRAQQSKPLVWKLLLTGSVKVPVPLAAALFLTMIALAAWAIWQESISKPGPQMVIAPPVSVRVVEVPVIQEKVVTQIVYVRPKTPNRSEARGKSGPGRGNRSSLAMFSSGSENGYVLQEDTDLKGFQPLQELKVKVLRRTDSNED